MATPTYPVGLVRNQGEQLSLSTTLALLGIPPNMYQAKLYVPTSDFRLHVNPAIKSVLFFDASNSDGTRWKDQWRNTTDRDTATGTGTNMNSATTSDFLYICVEEPVGGIYVTIGNANGNAATLTAAYRKNDDTWASVTATDGTASGGATFGQTGNITWTTPTDWRRAILGGGSGIFAPNAITDGRYDADAPGIEGHWLRFSWSAAFDASTSVTELYTNNRDTTRGYYYAGKEYFFSFDLRRVGSIEAVLASGTATMDVTWIRTF